MGLRGQRAARLDLTDEDGRPRFRQAKAWLRGATGHEPPGDHYLATQGEAHSEPAFEQHLSVEDLAAAWGLSKDFIRRVFLSEPGVVVFHHERPGRRVYRTLRIPSSVAVRVHRRMTKL